MYQIWPILKNLLIFNQISSEFELKALFWHMLQIISFVLSGVLFVGRIPERFYPGFFDLFGQSHHAFHLTIFLMAFSQSNAVFYDILSLSSNHIEFNLQKDLIYTLTALILQLVSVYLWFRISRPAIERRYETIKNN